MYADQTTGSMRYTIEETDRRRKIQQEFNSKHHIIPQTIVSSVKDSMQEHLHSSGYVAAGLEDTLLAVAEELPSFSTMAQLEKEIKRLEEEMMQAAKELAFEKAAELRDRIKKIRLLEIEIG